MGLQMRCVLCTDPSCDGKEYSVKYDYWYHGRQRGTKIVCSSQIRVQGNRRFHDISDNGGYIHSFLVEVNNEETVVNEAGQGDLGRNGELQTGRTETIRDHRGIPGEIDINENKE